MDLSKIRNFCIIAHIDHGKTTLSDRILEATKAVSPREMQEQFLDGMDLERERGITIKAHTVSLRYVDEKGDEYLLNLIDTPGHVDFNYEVSRALAACEGALLVVDASQGVEAQTLANAYLAVDLGLELVPVINKIDLPSARPDEIKHEIEDVIGLDCENVPLISAKENINIDQVLEQIVKLIPPPIGDEDAPLKALVFDSYYDSYRGVVAFVRIKEGQVKKGDKIKMMSSGKTFDVTEVGIISPTQKMVATLYSGDVGYLCASMKEVRSCQVGDTITNALNPATAPLPGYKKVTSMVYCGVYPAEGEDFNTVRDALEKLQVNDASLTFEPETSKALGFGFRCGFLGLLHMEIIQERLEREFNLNIIATTPSVIYKIYKTDGNMIILQNPTNMPPVQEIEYMEEPIVNASIMSPTEYVGSIMELCQNRRGIFINMEYMEATRVILHYKLPLNEVIYDFFDALKSKTRGYASLDYELSGYERSELVKMDILINGELVDAFQL